MRGSGAALGHIVGLAGCAYTHLLCLFVTADAPLYYFCFWIRLHSGGDRDSTSNGHRSMCVNLLILVLLGPPHARKAGANAPAHPSNVDSALHRIRWRRPDQTEPFQCHGKSSKISKTFHARSTEKRKGIGIVTPAPRLAAFRSAHRRASPCPRHHRPPAAPRLRRQPVGSRADCARPALP